MTGKWELVGGGKDVDAPMRACSGVNEHGLGEVELACDGLLLVLGYGGGGGGGSSRRVREKDHGKGVPGVGSGGEDIEGDEVEVVHHDGQVLPMVPCVFQCSVEGVAGGVNRSLCSLRSDSFS